MTDEQRNEAKAYFERIEEKYWENLEQAYRSGALDPNKESPTTVAVCVLKITAENAYIGDKGKKLLKNLRHFV
jgi:hypothetical protein